MALLDLLESWPGDQHGVIIVRGRSAGQRRVEQLGEVSAPLPWASVSKVATALSVLIGVEEGLISLDDDVGPPGVQVRHLLAHAGGIGLDVATVLCPPATRRIYSNAGFDLLASHLERWSGTPFEEHLHETVFGPLGMNETHLVGSPAAGVVGPLRELEALLDEVMAPTLLSPSFSAAWREPQWPALAGVLPGFGRCDPCPWGLGLEVKGSKSPHWTGTRFGPTTVGHFGQSGSFLVVSPEHDLGVVTLGDEPFGPWAKQAWPEFLDAVVEKLPQASGEDGGR